MNDSEFGYTDSTGKQICVGSRVSFRNEEFTVKAFGPRDEDGLCYIYFDEEINHTDEQPTELSVDRVT